MSTKIKKTYSLDSDLVKDFENQTKKEKRSFSNQLEIILSNWLRRQKKK